MATGWTWAGAVDEPLVAVSAWQAHPGRRAHLLSVVRATCFRSIRAGSRFRANCDVGSG